MAMNTQHGSGTPQLSWVLSDLEQRFGFAGGRHTRVNLLFTGIVAFVVTLALIAAGWPIRDTLVGAIFYRERNLPITCSILLLSVWSATILIVKWRKLRLQSRTLQMDILPAESDFYLSPQTVERVEDRIDELVDDPRHFLLFHRVSLALSNLRNLGRVGDVAEIFKTQSEYDEGSTETSYLVVSVFIWAIPVLGFIGTVLGLSAAIGDFGGVLAGGAEMDTIKLKLQDVTGNLATAFETTLFGLVAALTVQLLTVWLKKGEHEFLERCNDYCSRNVVSRLRLLPFESQSIDSGQSVG